MHRVPRSSRTLLSAQTRTRWCRCQPRTQLTLAFLALVAFCLLDTASADCWYEDERHEEGIEVATAEPCLNCTCSKGVLLCYLRVCPKLPNPPPPGCILLHRYRTCCPELICPDLPSGGNALEARSEPDDNMSIPFNSKILGNACIVNGTIYGPGSAMDSSSLCEYCYCLGGKQMCVKPKCLLPVEGCTPTYENTSCCPVHYNCTDLHQITSSTTSSTTTTLKPTVTQPYGCLVDGVYYPEGGKVVGVGHSICDNCYCLRGMLRCEPLSCAPPLLGCVPVIRTGECCAASYNCSGTIEIQPEPNYGQFPTVSKEYAKLRKEVQQLKPTTMNRRNTVTENSNMPYYVIAQTSDSINLQQRSPASVGTTRHFSGLTPKPYYYSPVVNKESLVSSENKHSTRSYVDNTYPSLYYATSNYEFQNKNYKKPFSTTTKPTSGIPTTDSKDQKLRSSDYLDLSDDSLLSIVDSLLDVRLNRKVENETTTTDVPTTESTSESTDTTTDDQSTTPTTTDILDETTTEPVTELNEISNFVQPVTFKTVTNTTDCIDNNETHVTNEPTTVLPVDANEINKLAELKTVDGYTTTDFSAEVTTETDDIAEVDLESKVKVSSVTVKSLGKIPPDVEAILNITKNKDTDYDYDYNEPSLPPSLPNLRIIPFVAADALDSKKQIAEENNIYPQERISDNSFIYSNLFSPPAETEGGFVPKEPPILENFYENAVTVPSITNPPKSNNELNCFVDNGKLPHGQSIPSDSPCKTCTCFYGNIVCQKAECPLPRPGCRKSTVQDLNTCCPAYVCDDEEAPTVVLDRADVNTQTKVEVVTVAEGVVTPDPFRDVIRTEPAPDLQSLIGDMPFLIRKTTPMPQFQSTTQKSQPTTTQEGTTTNGTSDDDFSLDKVLQLLFSGDKEESKEPSTTIVISPIKSTTLAPSTKQSDNYMLTTTEYAPKTKTKNKASNLNSVEPSPGVGLLKLAGCNIYGRMYRVGRIISELSGPCRECKCTEVGVQCRVLKC